jgi:hypothetical protein
MNRKSSSEFGLLVWYDPELKKIYIAINGTKTG